MPQRVRRGAGALTRSGMLQIVSGTGSDEVFRLATGQEDFLYEILELRLVSTAGMLRRVMLQIQASTRCSRDPSSLQPQARITSTRWVIVCPKDTVDFPHAVVEKTQPGCI